MTENGIGASVLRVKGMFTNTVPVDAYRGAGRPEALSEFKVKDLPIPATPERVWQAIQAAAG